MRDRRFPWPLDHAVAEVDGLQRLRRGVRRFLGAGGDLRGGALEFLCRGGGFGNAAGHLRRGGRHALCRFLLAREGACLALLRLGQGSRWGGVGSGGVVEFGDVREELYRAQRIS